MSRTAWQIKRDERMAKQPRTCARLGCGKPVPSLALRHGDPHCSTLCAKIAYGTVIRSGEDRSDKAPRTVRPVPFVINPAKFRRRPDA